ncbi:hypothetical protein HDV06_004016 [Boothiomyces sp. JEL0866]|nr:hypothetical protein HDV06_004016 [Boothiomyces sp. JEL0866]
MDKEVICDRIYENERGTIIFGKYNFSKKALLPTDVSPFSNESSSYVVDIKYYQCPPNYEWFSDWMVDMNGNVDEQGWSYNTTFYNDNWESTINKQNVSFVRRRKWMRMRRKCNIKTVKKEIFDIQQRTNDRQRLKFLQEQKELNENVLLPNLDFLYPVRV